MSGTAPYVDNVFHLGIGLALISSSQEGGINGVSLVLVRCKFGVAPTSLGSELVTFVNERLAGRDSGWRNITIAYLDIAM